MVLTCFSSLFQILSEVARTNVLFVFLVQPSQKPDRWAVGNAVGKVGSEVTCLSL